MGFFAPADLFSAVALAARGDADLPDGVHLRLLPAPVLGFPVTPFGIWRVTPYVIEPQLVWRDRSGKVLPQPALDAAGGVLIADIAAPSTDGSICDVAVELVAEAGFTGSLTLLDRVGNRVFASRSQAPFIVGGPRVERVRVEGRGIIRGLRVWRVDMQRVLEPLLGQAPLALFSLPIEGSRPWYANGLGPAASLDRVKSGAAKRLQQPDRPDGPFDALTPQDDVLRVSAHAANLAGQCERMVGNAGVLPRNQRLGGNAPATATTRQQIVDFGISDALLLQAQDPGIGRYLGLVGSLHEQTDGSQPLAYVTMGMFVYWALAQAPDGRTLSTVLGYEASLSPFEQSFVDRMGATEILKRVSQHNAGGSIQSRLLNWFNRYEMRGLLAVAGAVPPADPPRLGAPVMGASQWLASLTGPSDRFRQEFLFPAPPLGTLIGLARLEQGVWQSRHTMLALPAPASPRDRALPILLGRTQSKPPLLGFIKLLSSYMRRGLISDTPIPAGPAPATYRASLADLFGRFGELAQFDVAAPVRPRPPAPAPQTQLVLDGPDGVGGPPASPGHIDVTVSAPSVTLLAAGSLDIASLELTFDGAAVAASPITPIPAGAMQSVTARIDLPALSIGESRHGTLTATFIDTAGARSETVTRDLAYGDRRRPFVVPTGLGLIWTSRPGPAPEVELKLAWDGAAGTRYRVYIADEKGLGVVGASRAEVAVTGGHRDRAGALGGRARFRLLTEPPLDVSGGRVVLNERLPRALTTVQFLRVVPLTTQGREAEFDSCGVVAVAVPTDRGPPQPRVHVSVDEATSVATMSVEAVGLDLTELQAAEPGLFTLPPDASAHAPEFRLRRASGAVSDPVYARIVAAGPLTLMRDGGTISFVAQVTDPEPLKPFVRYSYWAEVRMPPERRLALGIVEVPPAGGVGPVIPSQIAEMARPYSSLSAPATVLNLPALPVPTLKGAVASITALAGTSAARLDAPATPSASTKAIGTYTLRIWEQWGNGTIVLAGPDVALNGSALVWTGTAGPDADRPHPLVLRYVVIDPAGREGALTTLP